MKNNVFRSFFILFVAIIILTAVSLLPLSDLTNQILDDYNLFSDITHSEYVPTEQNNLDDSDIDPELISIMNLRDSEENMTESDTVGILNLDRDDIENQIDTIEIEGGKRSGDTLMIEDYTDGKSGFKKLKLALSNDNGLVRVGFLGDSYIEGDIFTQNIRDLLQDEYGGSGVGYVYMHTDFPGFRKSVRQKSDGWLQYDPVNQNLSSNYTFITQQYFKTSNIAESTFKGSDYVKHGAKWDCSKFLFISPESTTIKIKTSDNWMDYPVPASDSVQCIEVNQQTSQFSVKVSSSKLISFGVWLDASKGIALDCMSTRGSSGVSLSRVNLDICEQISKFIKYDLIILEYGINAMSQGQTNFSAYAAKMENVVCHIRRCCPDADILIMGIGDRGERQGNEVHSMHNVPLMVSAQRRLARKMKCLFWDTREAMGGADASVRWANHKPAYINKDYIHLSYKGGEALALEFVKSFKLMLSGE